MPFQPASLALLLATLLSACSTPSPTTPPAVTPAYLISPTGCAIVAGGGIGSQFADKQVTAMWDKVNAAVTAELHDRLVQNRYKVLKFVVPTERTLKADDLVIADMAANRCNRLLQVSHRVDEDGSGKYFRFDITLFRIDPKQEARPDTGITTVRTSSEFMRGYRYPRTQESLDSFYTGTFAETVLADLTKSGSLAPLR
ncbi:MAG: hypothetical protein Q8R33_11555 [Burkholderiales bacterium]|nr:hypothetical protein [Burkholderiales bacterium]